MNLLEMSFSGAFFIIAVLVIRTAAVNRLPKKTFLILWEIIFLRLIFPFTIPAVFSIYTLMDHSISAPSLLDAEQLSSVISQEHYITVEDMAQTPAKSPSISILFVVWCVGMMLFAVLFAISYLRCLLEFRTALPVNSVYAEQWLKERPLKRRISIRQSDRISAPLTYGIFRPVILMPKKTDWENMCQLQYILSHEYVHIRRFDAFTKLAAALILCIHWFNPFVWVMYVFFNRDIELACDESVIKQFGENAKSAYSLMLINMGAGRTGLPSFYSNFSKNVIEERITAIMHTKRTTLVTLFSSCLIVLVTAGLFATSAAASTAASPAPISADREPQTAAEDFAADKNKPLSIAHQSADILRYEDGAPYIHDILTNNTDRAISETQYCMLAFDKNGMPLKLHWNFLDSSAESSFENIVRSQENLLPGQTEDYRGGWSLYDDNVMADFPRTENGKANQTAYALLCLKQVVFEDGSVWNNPGYENWFMTYAGKETDVTELQNYYPHEYLIESN